MRRRNTSILTAADAQTIMQNAAKWRSQIGTLSLYASKVKRKGVVAKDYAATQKQDEYRKKVLLDGRTLSPINTIFRVDLLNQTVLYAIFRSPTTWVVFGTYIMSFTCTFLNLWPEVIVDFDKDSFSGADLLVTFMIVFYVGYCYSRYMDMFNDLELVMRCILNICVVARTSFKDMAALYDLWRYLNLLHVTAYCGVTQTYTRENLFDDFCEAHALLLNPAVRMRFNEMEIDTKGSLACNTCMVWAMQTIHTRAEAGDFTAPIHKEMVTLLTNIGSGLNRLYAREYQVLPYIYTHLVSLSCFGYLAASAFLKGLEAPLHQPQPTGNSTEPIDYSVYRNAERTTTFGLVLPLASMILMLVTIFGLLHIGSKLANPLGATKEAFAVCHFVNYTASTSLEIVSAQPAPHLVQKQLGAAGNSNREMGSSSGGSASLKNLGATFETQAQLLKEESRRAYEEKQQRETAIAARISRYMPPVAKALGRKNRAWESAISERSRRQSDDGDDVTSWREQSESPSQRSGGRRSPFVVADEGEASPASRQTDVRFADQQRDDVAGTGSESGGDESGKSAHASPRLDATVPEMDGGVAAPGLTPAEQQEIEQLKMINAMQAYQLKRRSIGHGSPTGSGSGSGLLAGLRPPMAPRAASSNNVNNVRPKSVTVEMNANI